MGTPQGKRTIVRLKEPIAFGIEPMPSKVHFRFELDENRDQTLVGDFYHVMIDFEPEADITLTDIALTIERVEVEVQVIDVPMVDSRDLMQSQSLVDDQSSVNKSTNLS